MANEPNNDMWMTREDVARMYRVSVRTVKRWEAAGKLGEKRKAGKYALFSREVVEALADTDKAAPRCYRADALQAIVAALKWGEDAGLAAGDEYDGTLILGANQVATIGDEAKDLLAEAMELARGVEGHEDERMVTHYDLTAI